MRRRTLDRAVIALAAGAVVVAGTVTGASAAPNGRPATISTTSTTTTTTSTTTTTPPAPTVDDLKRSLDAKLQTWQARYGATGVAAAVDVPGVVHWAGSAGSIDGSAPYTPTQQARVGSATKTFTSVIVLQLVQEGRLSLDDPLAKWEPTFPGAYSIKVRNLLNHTSGIPELQLDDLFFILGSLFNPYRHWTIPDMIDFARSPLPIWSLRRQAFVQRSLLYAPGDGWTYSQMNFVLLGDIVEKVTNKPYSVNVNERIVQPLGLRHTVFADSSYSPWLLGHTNLLGLFPVLLPTTAIPSYEAATSGAFSAGAMVSTPEDQITFIQAVHDGRLLKPATLALMQTTVPLQVPGGAASPDSRYGLGVFQNTYAGHTTWGHGGAIPGFTSAMAYEPATKLSVSVECNSDNEATPKNPTTPTRQVATIDWDLRLTTDDWLAARARATAQAVAPRT